MKPREKLVTAEDVGSSLYYCHVDSADDDRIREALQSADEIEALQDARARAQIPLPTVWGWHRESIYRQPLN